jgi:hypothetical protein
MKMSASRICPSSLYVEIVTANAEVGGTNGSDCHPARVKFDLIFSVSIRSRLADHICQLMFTATGVLILNQDLRHFSMLQLMI